MNEAFFVDKEGTPWHLHITFGDVLRVKEHVLGADGKPLDLCYIAETGNFRQVIDHIEIVVQCVYWLLEKAIHERTNAYSSYTMEWFYNRIDAGVLPNLIKAWYEALLNFTPYPVIKSTMMTAGELRKKQEIIAAINILAGQLEACMNTEESSELTQEDSLTVNSARWLNPV